MSDNEAQSNAAPGAGDLVERLRTSATAGNLCDEAADTIAALRQQVAEAKGIAIEAQSESAAYHWMMDRAEKERDELHARVSELTMHQSLQDAATAAVMERAENAERERDGASEELAAVTEERDAYDKRLAAALKVPGCHPEEMLNVIDSLMKDAERYRRLRENWIDCEELQFHGRLSAIDARLDAAMQGKETKCP